MAVGGSRNFRRFLVTDCEVLVQTGLLGRERALFPVVNLGQGGIQFIAFRPFKVGQRVQISLKVGEQFGYVKAQAEIRWLEGVPGERAFRTGASFVRMSEEDAARLRGLEQRFWPRQAEIQEMGLKRLKLPTRVAQKLSIMIQQAGQRIEHPTVMLMRADGMSAPVGDITNLSQSQVGFGQWVDTRRGLVFKDPRESYEYRKGAPSGDTEKVELPAKNGAEAEAAPASADAATRPDDDTGEVEILEDDESGAQEAPAASAVGDAPEEPAGEQAAAAAETGPPLRAPIPLFLLSEERQIAVDEAGRPVSSCATTLSIPGIRTGCFACRLADDSMSADREKRFKLGDIIVFSMQRKPTDGCFAFVATKERVCFRQVYFAPDDMVMLRALNPSEPVALVRCDEVVGIWPCIAHIQLT